ncbi:hypothetical protein N9E38_00505 [Yoonia sp.]|nr:hypothetical protein [Yoonia sp.]
MKRTLTALTVAATMSASGVSAANDMQICQMVDTLVWTLKDGFPDPTEIEEYSAPYDVLVDRGQIYARDSVEGNGKYFKPIEFDKNGNATHDGSSWFKVSETEFRIMGYDAAWHSKITCPDEM